MTNFTDTLKRLAVDEHIGRGDMTEDEAATLREKNGLTATGQSEFNALAAEMTKADEQTRQGLGIGATEATKRFALEDKIGRGDMTEDEAKELYNRAGLSR